MTASIDDAVDLEMVYDSAMDFLKGIGGLSHARALRFTGRGFDREIWQAVVAMGWPAVMVGEADGGSGLGVRAYTRIARAAGRYLLPEPLVSAVLANGILTGERLAASLRGDILVLPASQERPGSADIADARLEQGRCHARRAFVAQGAGADFYLVSYAGGWALVAGDDGGVARSHRATQDGGHCSDLIFDGAAVVERYAPNVLAFEAAILGQAAYQLGMAQAAFDMTVAYLCAREQFGKPIGSFQALQHRTADMKIQLDLAQASLDSASGLLGQDAVDLGRKRAAVSRAKARSNNAAMLVTREAVQMHGAIGYTDEYDVGLFLRGAMTHCPRYGSTAYHLERYGQLLNTGN